MRFEQLLAEGKTVTAGILQYRFKGNTLQVFLAKPGGPLWKGRDDGSWSIPKGKVNDGETPKRAAVREFSEEIGVRPVTKNMMSLGSAPLANKTMYVWAVEGEKEFKRSNTFEMEWPPKSGKMKKFPEIETARFYNIPEALRKINQRQKVFIERLQDNL